MSWASDLKILYHMALRPVRGSSHAERLESFYAGQAGDYDAFRQRLLHGRQRMWQALQVPFQGVWVDLGGGTGANLENLGDEIHKLGRVYVVDLARSLLEVARRRSVQQGWHHVETIAADATTFCPPEGQVDVVTLSYSLTMIPDWFAALENARKILKPGGQIGVVDFYVSRKHPEPGRSKHGWWTRTGWPIWFALDNVYPSPDHLPYLTRNFETIFLEESRGRIPYLPLVRAPYYIFVGRKSRE